jgi:hypothetical protein
MSTRMPITPAGVRKLGVPPQSISDKAGVRPEVLANVGPIHQAYGIGQTTEAYGNAPLLYRTSCSIGVLFNPRRLTGA